MRPARLFMCAALLLAVATGAQGAGEAALRPLTWPDDSTFEFGIYKKGQRDATAYYRILKEVTQGREVYRFKYVGRNEQMSEASECWVDPQTLAPLRSTRKLIQGGRTFYQDVGYQWNQPGGGGTVVVRSKYEGEPVTQREIPAPSLLYDYEELLWLVPQLELGGELSGQINLFDTLGTVQTPVLINDDGAVELEVQGRQYACHKYSFSVGMTPYQFWVVDQRGQATPARVDMGSRSFINLKLDPKLVQAAPARPVPAQPEPEPEAPADPNNPLGPPPAGGDY